MYKLMLSAQTITRLSVIKHQSSAHNKGPSPQGFITILECIFTFQLHKPSQSRVYASGGFNKEREEQMYLKNHKKLFPPPPHTQKKKAKPDQEETCTHLHLPLSQRPGRGGKQCYYLWRNKPVFTGEEALTIALDHSNHQLLPSTNQGDSRKNHRDRDREYITSSRNLWRRCTNLGPTGNPRKERRRVGEAEETFSRKFRNTAIIKP